MRLAVLDLGTNTFHLLVADRQKDRFVIVHNSKIAVKLGEGAIQHHWIAPRPFRRGLDALQAFEEKIRQYAPDRVVAYATSAIRGASNGHNFIRAAQRETGITIEVIQGSREAELIYLGVRQCIDMQEKFLIMDIGGGSTEFIIANNQKIFWKQSFDIGAARILELYTPSDPVKRKELEDIGQFLESKLVKLDAAIRRYPVDKLAGSSGSFETFAGMIGFTFHGKDLIRNMNSFKFNLSEYRKLSRTLLKSTREERLKMKGLIKMRVDMIVIATICTNFILRKHSIKEMYLSKYALKEGALWELIHSHP
jgi:exopolyphosphatase/guanosine-5'-triphosphate,3'-diphosphate pyrophosphatase